MAAPDDRPYVIERREVVAETDTLRVSILTLAEGQEVPWHYHTAGSPIRSAAWKAPCRWKHVPRRRVTCSTSVKAVPWRR